jgi:hypothetical protein
VQNIRNSNPPLQLSFAHVMGISLIAASSGFEGAILFLAKLFLQNTDYKWCAILIFLLNSLNTTAEQSRFAWAKAYLPDCKQSDWYFT